MKKIFAILLAVMLIASMTVTTHAATPELNIPDIEIPDISDSVKDNIEIDVTHAIDSWLDEHPFRIDWSKIDFSKIKLWGCN